MDTTKLIHGSLFRHPDGRTYQVRELAKHAETGEEMLVYQEMQPPYQIWVRPLSGTGKRQGSQTAQAAGASAGQGNDAAFSGQGAGDVRPAGTGRAVQEAAGTQDRLDTGGAQLEKAVQNGGNGQKLPEVQVSDGELKEILINGQAEKRLAGKLSDEEIARRGFLAILDAEGNRERRQLLVGLEPYLSELHLNNLAVAMDIVLEEGSRQDHYDAILHCLQTYERYEGRRLRS